MTNVKNTVRARALDLIFKSGGISRSSIAENLSVSAVTAGKAAGYLLECGAVIQRSGKCGGDARKTMLLYPNPNLHSFVFDTSSGRLYFVQANGSPKQIADYGRSCAHDAGSLTAALNASSELISTYKYKKYCLGSFFLTGSKVTVSLPDGMTRKDCHQVLSAVNTDDGRLMLHLSPSGIAYSFGCAVSADITDAFGEAKRAYACFKDGHSVKDAAEAASKLIISLVKIFTPSSVSVTESGFDHSVFSELTSAALAAERAGIIPTFAGETAIISSVSDAAAREYIENI